MDKFQKTFLQEAEELMDDLEQALLRLEDDFEDKQCISEIFRAMHSLKGGGSMFGFDTISSITHHLETIYDQIRNNELKANRNILDVTFEAVDHLKHSLMDQQLSEDYNRKKHQEVMLKIEALRSEVDNGQEELDSSESTLTMATYYVLVSPKESIFANGTNPLYLIDDLSALGKCLVLPSLTSLPVLKEVEPDKCYTQFEVLISTELPKEEIKDVFIFAEDQCDLQVEMICGGDLLDFEPLISALESKRLDEDILGYDAVKNIVQLHLNESSKSIKKSKKDIAKTESSIRVSSDKLDELMNLVSELVTTQAQISLIAEQKGIEELTELGENMEKITRRLRDNAFSICLVPIQVLVTRFQRLVRDLSNDLGKEVQFITSGTETELDKSIIENISDPILHIIRNSIDHGIETSEERVKKGKSPVGKLELSAFYSGTYVYVQLRDDGQGINPESVKKKAIQNGLIISGDQLTEKEALELVFMPGFSTAEEITDVSGRGVGMDVVKRKIEALKGDVTIASKINEGTSITIKLPLTLSIIDGMLVEIAETKYIIPLDFVDKCYEIYTSKLDGEDSQKYVFEGSMLPVLNTRACFGFQAFSGDITQVIKLTYEEFPVCITVDHIIGQYQAAMKPLGEHYESQDEFSGATILGDGSVALVLDVMRFVRQHLMVKELKLEH
ncbi:chemotaxis protein CheA [Fulvivirga sediminis]|uniref:Chemotaxis protein CheA n=1 Tax=Fulvivirga sediminis TaxID=2803949 RepID=A0A937K2Q0_9BACT|nr:chemotaxis protein CheA [Fulvivirga sediminis]MBL3658600.1 chemotaxis protein CheA [Fulvivirga sediminis]